MENKSDKHILRDDDSEIGLKPEDFAVSESMMKIYKEQAQQLKDQQRTKVRRDVCEIIKRNSKQNLDELNKKVAALFNMDEKFKELLLNHNNL